MIGTVESFLYAFCQFIGGSSDIKKIYGEDILPLTREKLDRIIKDEIKARNKKNIEEWYKKKEILKKPIN